MNKTFKGELTLEQIYQVCNHYSAGIIPKFDLQKDKIKVPYIHDVASAYQNKPLQRIVESIDRRLRGQADLSKAALIDTPMFETALGKNVSEKNFGIRLGVAKINEKTGNITFIDNEDTLKARVICVARINTLLEGINLMIGGIDGELIGQTMDGTPKVQMHLYITKK